MHLSVQVWYSDAIAITSCSNNTIRYNIPLVPGVIKVLWVTLTVFPSTRRVVVELHFNSDDCNREGGHLHTEE